MTAQERRSGRFVAGAVGLVLLVLAVVGIAALLNTGGPEAGTPAVPTSALPPPTPPPPEVTWLDAGGVEVPVSRTHGPRDTADGLAKGFSRSEDGAALAAANLLIRTGPTVGPRVFKPTVTGQATGANVAALNLAVNEQYEQLRKSAGIPAGEPVPGANGELVGYHLGTYADSSGAATVDIVLTSPDLAASERFLQVTVALQWINDDWWVIAPPNGDWSTVSTPLGSAPTGLLRYQDVG